jgi:hypothetical protein
MNRDKKKTQLNRQVIRPLIPLTGEQLRAAAGASQLCVSVNSATEGQPGCNQH